MNPKKKRSTNLAARKTTGSQRKIRTLKTYGPGRDCSADAVLLIVKVTVSDQVPIDVERRSTQNDLTLSAATKKPCATGASKISEMRRSASSRRVLRVAWAACWAHLVKHSKV